jgi:prepilin signal peptidase PulO-like enzyme (type II secretory pathway)
MLPMHGTENLLSSPRHHFLSSTVAAWLALLLAAEPIRQSLVPLWTMELLASAFLYAWLFCVGACIGSFLNVVVYRLPRGMNLVGPSSFCPRCRHPIRLRDNIPIVSWLVLRGHCRDCHNPISSRYFWVELAVATIFLAVALVETRLTGSLPTRNWNASRWLISPYETVPFWSAYALHVALLTTLLGAALIDCDGFRTPGAMFLPVIVATLALPALWPLLYHDQPLFAGLQAGWEAGLAAGLAGWAAGLAVGTLVSVLWRVSARRDRPRFNSVGLFVAAGVVVGWQHVLQIAALSGLLFAGAILVLRLRRAVAVVPLAALILCAALPRLLDLDLRLQAPLDLPADYYGTVAAACLAVVALASLAAGWFAPPQYFAPPAADPPPIELRAESAATTSSTEGTKSSP